LPLLLATVPRRTLAFDLAVAIRATPIVPAARPRADPAHAPPTQPRAPPLA
jgi:hypothetical protein